MPESQAGSPFESVRPPRPLPVLVLADVSGSMAEHGKIESLNLALATMIQALARERSPRGEITVGVITFGGAGVTLHQQPTPASTVTWADMVVVGGPEGTPMGLTFERVQRALENEELVPARAYDATLVPISDGRPTTEWQPQLTRLLDSPRGKRSLRLAAAIGPDTGSAAYEVLESFVASLSERIGDLPGQAFRARPLPDHTSGSLGDDDRIGKLVWWPRVLQQWRPCVPQCAQGRKDVPFGKAA